MRNKKKTTKENNDSISEETKETELQEAPEETSEVTQTNTENKKIQKNKVIETDETQVAEEATEIPKSRISQKTIMALGVVVIFAVVGVIFFFSIELPPTGQIVMSGLEAVEPGEITTFQHNRGTWLVSKQHDFALCLYCHMNIGYIPQQTKSPTIRKRLQSVYLHSLAIHNPA